MKIRIWHDNKFLRSGWLLKQVDIEDLSESRTYEFQCNRWLAKDEDDGSIIRELPCSNKEPDVGSPSREHKSRKRDFHVIKASLYAYLCAVLS